MSLNKNRQIKQEMNTDEARNRDNKSKINERNKCRIKTLKESLRFKKIVTILMLVSKHK